MRRKSEHVEQARISLRFISHVAVTVCALRPSISVAPESRNVFLFLFIFSSPFALLDGSVSVQDGRTDPVTLLPLVLLSWRSPLLRVTLW